MKKEQQNNSTSNALVTTTTTQGILDNGQKELLAGGKVRSKAGGPEMVLVGFTTENRHFRDAKVYADKEKYKDIQEGDKLYNQLSYGQLSKLAMKVIMNEEGKYGYSRTFHTQEFYSCTSYNYSNQYSSDPFYCICKYWSNKDEEFKHILLLPSEIEFI